MGKRMYPHDEKRVKLLYRILILLLMGSLLLCAGTAAYGRSLSGDASAVKGIINLASTEKSSVSQEMELSGEWEFYWKRLLTPEQLNQDGATPGYIKVPGQWGGQKIQGEAISNFGYGTYRLQLKVPAVDIGTTKLIHLSDIGSAYKVWIDGQVYGGLGVVGTRRAEETAEFHTRFILFKPKAEHVDILIQVSNYSFREGGIIGKLGYSEIETFAVAMRNKLLLPALVVGGLFVVGLYQLMVYSIGRRKKSTIYIGLLSWGIMLRSLFLSEDLTHNLFPFFKWEYMVKLEYLSELVAFTMLILLMRHLYPQEFRLHNIRVIFGTISFLALYVLLTPARIYTSTMLIHYGILLAAILYYVYYIGIAAVIRRREGARINLAGLLVLVAAGVNDTLFYFGAIPTFEMIDYAVIIFILLQAVIVSYRNSILFEENKRLTGQLVQFNQSLEEKVKARTEDLHTKNDELSRLHQTKTTMLANISHDLGSPIAGIQIYLQLMKEGKIQSGDVNVIGLLLEKATHIKRLNHDLFELSKLESRQLSFQLERVLLREYIEEVYQAFTQDLMHNDRVLDLGRMETFIDGREVFVLIDKIRIKQVLQNYIENAIKFSPPAMTVTFSCYIDLIELDNRSEPHAVIEVTDYGLGISEEVIPQVFNRFYKREEGNSGGTGLGLTIAKEIIEQHQGTIGVVSELEKGSTFFFTLPGIRI